VLPTCRSVHFLEHRLFADCMFGAAGLYVLDLGALVPYALVARGARCYTPVVCFGLGSSRAVIYALS
jgi:hypothetical protein